MNEFCPSVFFYLCSVVPPIWILELDLASSRANASASWNATDCYSMQKFPPTNPSTKEALSRLLDIYLPLALPREQWAKILEQMLLVILIVGRWLLPKGELTRDQLSQLLLVYIAMAADIVELFEAFKEKEVIVNKELTFYILGQMCQRFLSWF
ncbi:unnamed protein product [Darwinula stevensoni]|uniref:Uncharacterized protein n=1 Tax=Darwinula stevensoni TaxID=69355 RepID=A0A7R9A735_9CRUS|nr:unnamed protein product [Darwinula stevensoni]CAG0890063.1 unnamed protein product [Darwinula stevensoni]